MEEADKKGYEKEMRMMQVDDKVPAKRIGKDGNGNYNK